MAGFPGTRWPLIQAPMAGAQGSALAISVGRAGALGSLPAAMLDAAALRRELAAIRAAGVPCHVNFFAHTPPVDDPALQARWLARLAPSYARLGVAPPAAGAGGATRRPFGDEAAEVLEELPPDVVSFHFGLPSPALLDRVRRLGARVLSSATTVDEARWLADHGADAVLAQGLEAGGHRGHFLQRDPARQLPLDELLSQVLAAVNLPVIAAGGIASAARVRECLQMGAAAVQVGTAFLCCNEASTSALHRARLADVQAPTELTNLFSGGLARGLVNRAMRELGPVCADAPPFPLASAAIGPLRSAGEAQGLDDFTPLWSGTDRSGCRQAPAADVVAMLTAGLR